LSAGPGADTPGERRALTVFFPAMGQGRADKLTQRAEMSAITGDELAPGHRATGAGPNSAGRRRARPAWTRSSPRAGPWSGRVRPLPSQLPNTWAVSEVRSSSWDASIRNPGFIPLRLGPGPGLGSRPRDPAGRGAARAGGVALCSGRGERRRAGRGVSELLSDFGLDLPMRAEVQGPELEANLFPRLVSARGPMGVGAGWACSPAPLSTVADDLGARDSGVLAAHRRTRACPDRRADGASTSCRAGPSFGRPGRLVLRDDIATTNPNVFIFGKPGRGNVRDRQVLLPADDGLRVPHPGAGRSEGRVRAVRAGHWGWSRSRSATD